jgi:hypothetical protein
MILTDKMARHACRLSALRLIQSKRPAESMLIHAPVMHNLQNQRHEYDETCHQQPI